jgi:LysM repeat protein
VLLGMRRSDIHAIALPPPCSYNWIVRRPFNSSPLGLLLLLGLATLGAACAGPSMVTAAAVVPATSTLSSSSARPSDFTSALGRPAVATPIPSAPAAGIRPTATPVITNAPRPTSALTGTVYTVVAGDTLWGIAKRFGLTPQRLVDANPTLNPNLLQLGDFIQIPGPNSAVRVPTNVAARVRIDGGGLRLRNAPELSAEVLAYLDALTPLDVVGRTADNAWIQVSTPSAQTGWVTAAWTNIYLSLADVPVTGADLPVNVASASAIAPTADSPPAASTAGLVRGSYASYVSGITAHARQVFKLGQSLGNKPNVFSKVGDSITASPVFLSPVGAGHYDLHNYAELRGLIDFYTAGIARGNDNSFDNLSLAAKVSWRVRAELSPEVADPANCDAGEAPLACEYRRVRPSVALIMLGTNDVPSTSDANFEADLRQVVQLTLDHGIVPVLSTIPPLFRTGLDGRAEQLNVIIVKLARAYDIPLWDYWSALQALPKTGMASDGVHPNWAPQGHNADFAPEYLQYGMVVRNLTALYVLDAIWRQVLQP